MTAKDTRESWERCRESVHAMLDNFEQKRGESDLGPRHASLGLFTLNWVRLRWRNLWCCCTVIGGCTD
jgi:hypothetical protein